MEDPGYCLFQHLGFSLDNKTLLNPFRTLNLCNSCFNVSLVTLKPRWNGDQVSLLLKSH